MRAPNCSAHSEAVAVTAGALLALESGLGLLANALALWALLFRLKAWKPYAVYLFNLAVADLLLTVCLPFHAAFFLRRKPWRSGLAPCRALLFLWRLSRGAGVAFLTAVALDRYFRVVHPRLKVNLLTPRGAQVISGLVWLLVGALSHRSFLVSEAECPRPDPRGGASFRLTWWEALSFLQFIVPFSLILFCSASIIRTLRKKLRDPDKQPKLQRARALVAAVAALFALCFLPSFLAQVSTAILLGTDSCAVQRALVHAADVTSSLTGLQSVLNPVVYCFSSPAFRHSYRKVFYTLRGRGPGAPAPACDSQDSCS